MAHERKWSELFYVAVALAASTPIWLVRYPPLQDLPYHLATIRVLHSIHDPAFGLDSDFVLTLGRTQYLAYYLLGSALTYVFGVIKANAILMTFYFSGTVLGARSLLKALNRDERLCLLVVPLLVNPIFILGLFPFLLGFPLMLFALATAIRYVTAPTTRGAVLLGLQALLLFFFHVVPFGVFAIGVVVIFPWRRPREWLRIGAPLAPAAVAALWWLWFTPAGKVTRQTLGAPAGGPGEGRAPLSLAFSRIYEWTGNVFPDSSDEYIFLALVVVVASGAVLARRDHARGSTLLMRYALVPLACTFFYFTTRDGHLFIWPLAQRFPIIALLTAIPLLRIPRGYRGCLVTGGAFAVACASVVNTSLHFVAFERDEVGDFEGAIASMEPQKRVAALIFDAGSRHVNQAPFLHFGSYYQVYKGGVVQHTFAGFPHWPIDFKPGREPPEGKPVRLMWEWTPNTISVGDELYPYYDYILTRGGALLPPYGTYQVAFEGRFWTVWKRDD